MQLLDQFFLSFGILSLVALLGGFLSTRGKLPVVVGLILAGMLMGPYGLGVIKDNDFIHLFAEVGAVMLLFSIGVEFSLSKIMGSGVRVLLMASAIMLVLFAVGYGLGVLLGLGYMQTLALAACLTFSSTAIFVRLLQQYKLVDQPQVPVLISILVIEDLVAVAAMAFFAALGPESAQAGQVPAVAIALSLLFSVAVMGTVYLVVRASFKRLRPYTAGLHTRDNLILLALGLCVLLAFLAHAIGLSPAIGAFLAGSILAGFSIRDEVEKMLSPFSVAFSSFFFISIGLMVNPAIAIANWPLILLISGAFMLTAFLIVAFTMFLSGFTFSQSVLAGISMGVLGEFSLFLAKETNSLVPSLDLITLMSASVMLTTLGASLLLSKAPTITASLRESCSINSRSWMCQLRSYTSYVLSQFEGQGIFLHRARSAFAALRRHVALFAVLGIIIFASRRLLASSVVDVFGYQIYLPTFTLLVSFVLLLPAIRDLWQELKLLADALAEAFMHKRNPDERAGRRMARDFLLLVGLLLFALLVPLAVDTLLLPKIFHLGVLLPLAGMFIVVWDMLSTLHRSFKNRQNADVDAPFNAT